MVNFCSLSLTLKDKYDGDVSPVPLSDFVRFVFCAVAAVWLLLRHGSSNLVPLVAAWVVFRLVTDYFGLVSDKES